MSAPPQPHSPNAFSDLFDSALAAAHARDFCKAAELFGRAIELKPDHAPAHCNRATALSELKQWEAALAGFDGALALKSDYAVAWSNRGNALKELRRWDDALTSYDRALALNPCYAEAHSNRGTVLKELNQLDAALDSFDAALAKNPMVAEAHSNRGAVLAALGRSEAALVSYDRALAISPGYAAAHSNRGNLLHELGFMSHALASYDHALALEPDLAQAHFNRSMTRLALGDFANGWVDAEWRWHVPGGDPRSFEQPLWLGAENITGSVILLHGEQGFGDVLQFCRYAKAVAQLGATVILEAPAALVRLLSSLNGVTRVVARGTALPPFDYHCPLMSLPMAFHTTVATIPAEIPYLRCDSQQAFEWREKLGRGLRPRVGLVWSGGFRPGLPSTWAVNQRRNVPLAKLAPLESAAVDFYSLQKGEPAESELATLVASKWRGPHMIDHTAELKDFSDTAAFIENLDLVISVDSSVAHLAGALGKPVWIVNRFDACWRWLRDRDDSPWYPTAKLYRQSAPGDWDGVVQQVALDLAHWAGARLRSG
jgi:tetratricopeptide (TPR) repeat protein